MREGVWEQRCIPTLCGGRGHPRVNPANSCQARAAGRASRNRMNHSALSRNTAHQSMFTPSRRLLRSLWPADNYVCQLCQKPRAFSTRAPLRSGHSKWATIKHDKGKNDAAKNKQRSVFSHELANASKCELASTAFRRMLSNFAQSTVLIPTSTHDSP